MEMYLSLVQATRLHNKKNKEIFRRICWRQFWSMLFYMKKVPRVYKNLIVGDPAVINDAIKLKKKSW